MNKIYGLAMCSAVVLLSACGSSSSVDVTGGGAVSSKDVSLGNKVDALRELNVSSALASQVAGGKIGINAGGAHSKLVRASSFAGGERATVTLKSSQAGNGNGGGTFKTDSDVGSHSFSYFGASQTVGLTRRNDANLKSSWTGQDGATESLTLNGVAETGGADGLPLSYDTFGEGSGYYTETYEKKNGSKVVDSSTLQFLGTSEVKAPADGPVDARAILSYRYSAKDGNFFNSDVGEAGAPFTVVQGDKLSYNGAYAYSYKGRSGGKAKVTTVEPVLVNDAIGLPKSGSLKFESGSDIATFTFKPDGGATLKVNEKTEEVSAEEIRKALYGQPS